MRHDLFNAFGSDKHTPLVNDALIP